MVAALPRRAPPRRRCGMLRSGPVAATARRVVSGLFRGEAMRGAAMTRSSHEDNEDNDSYVDSPVDSPVSAADAANSAALAGSASPTGPTGPDAAAVADLRAADSASAARAVSHELRCLEAAEGVRVLLAVESGSRAWGFESPDSDFDVRFVYVRPIEYYLRLQSTRDVLEWRLDEVLDVSGWDLDKALRLMRGANPSLFEWLASPIVYAEYSAFAAVRDLAADCFSPVSSAHHYLSMARTGMSGLTGTTRMADKADKAAVAGETIRLKKCLYAMRAILASRWVVAERVPVPMLFRDLVDAQLEASMRGLVDELLEAKAVAGECDEYPRIPALSTWAASAVAELEEDVAALVPKPKMAWERLNDVFLGFLDMDRTPVGDSR